jgi:hypothetical protein
MKILAIVEDLRINKTSCGIINANFISGLIQNNHQIHCIYDYSESNTFPFLNSPLLKTESIKKVKYNLFFKLLNKIPKGNSIHARLTGFNIYEKLKIKNWTIAVKSTLSKNNYDLIVYLGSGNSMLNYFSLLKIETNTTVLVNYHDPYPNNQYPHPYKTNNNWVNKIKTKKSNKIMKKATSISFPSLLLLNWMKKFHPILENKSIIIPHLNGNLKNLNESENDKLVHLKENCFNIVHGGSLLGPRNPEFLIKAFKKFIEEDPERKEKAYLNIIGGIDIKNNIKNINFQGFLENIIIIKERISYKKSKEIFKNANILLLIEAISNESPFLPGKTIDYIEANKNIFALTPKSSEISRLFGEEYPYITQTNNEEEIYNILVVLWEKWKNNNLDVILPRFLNDYISIENQEKIIKTLIN